MRQSVVSRDKQDVALEYSMERNFVICIIK